MLSTKGPNLIEKFNSNGITLLVRPRKHLDLLRVYKNELNQTKVIRGQGPLESFIIARGDRQLSNTSFSRPSKNIDKIAGGVESGALLHSKNVNVAMDFFKGLFDPLLAHLGIDISAKIDNSKIYAATFSLSSFLSEEIDNTALEESLKAFKIKDDKAPDFANSQLFINTGVYYCDKLEITIAQLDNIEMNFLTSAQLVEAGVKVSSDKQGYNQIKYEETVAFGARFALLDFSFLRDLPIKVIDVPSDEGKIPLVGEPGLPVLPFVNIEDS